MELRVVTAGLVAEDWNFSLDILRAAACFGCDVFVGADANGWTP